MQGCPSHAKVEVSTDEREQAGYGEATLLAEDTGRGGDERGIEAGVLATTTCAGNAGAPVGAGPDGERGGKGGGGARRAGGGGVWPGGRRRAGGRAWRGG